MELFSPLIELIHDIKRLKHGVPQSSIYPFIETTDSSTELAGATVRAIVLGNF